MIFDCSPNFLFSLENVCVKEKKVMREWNRKRKEVNKQKIRKACVQKQEDHSDVEWT